MHDDLPNFGEIFMKLSGSMETRHGQEERQSERKRKRQGVRLIERETDRQRLTHKKIDK